MRLLLTSAGIKNASIHDALVDVLGKPIAECSALCIPTAMYGHPMAGPGAKAWEFIAGRSQQPMCELGWKSLGVLELTALPSIAEERWVTWVRETDVLLVNGGALVSVLLDAAVRAGRPLAVAARNLGGAECREHGDDASDRGVLRELDSAQRWRQHAGGCGFFNLPAPG